MIMADRYGIPSTKIISLMKYLQVPLGQIQPGDKILVMTDDAMDPLVWQAFMAVINEKGGEPALCLFPRLKYHCADPPPAAIEAAKVSDGVVALTTTCMNSGTPGLRSIREADNTRIWLMDENNVEILTEGGGTSTFEDIKEMVELHKRIGAIYDRGKKIRLLSEYGTDYTADISGYPKDYHFTKAAKLPFQRDPKTGSLGGGTWPYGEIHVEPLPGTGNGTVVWDTTGHHPPGLWKDPVKLTIRDGRVVEFSGGVEAQEVKQYLQKYGDKDSYSIGGEMGLGTNKQCPPRTGVMRGEKKRYGSMHFGIGTGPDRYLFDKDPSRKVNSTLRLEGIIGKVTVIVDDKINVCENGVITV